MQEQSAYLGQVQCLVQKQSAALRQEQCSVQDRNYKLKNKVSELEAQKLENSELIKQLFDQKGELFAQCSKDLEEKLKSEIDAITKNGIFEAAANDSGEHFNNDCSIGLAGESHWDAENSPSDVLFQ